MREGWKEVRLGEVISTNKTNLNKNFNFEKILYVDISSVGSGEINFNEEILLNDAPSRAKRLIGNGDTIVSSVRPANRNFAYFKEVPDNLVVSTGFTTLHPIESEINSRYLYYLISNNTFTEYLVSVEKGANYPAVTAKDIEDYIFNLPPLETQKKIASILSGYDDLIENNLKRIKILEEMAQQTYEEWFVRMRFPGHESAIINKETGLPEGWEKKKAHDIFKITIGKTPPRGEDTWFNSTEDDNKIKWASITDIRNSNVFIYNSKETLTKEAIEKYNFNFVKKGNVILSFKLTVGLVAIASEDMTTNEAIAHFNNALLPASYTYYFLKNFDYPSLGSTSSIGTAINSKIVKIIPFVVPEQSLINRFDELIKPMLSSIDNLNNQNQRLREARDILLPRLMMGMIEV